MTPSWIESALAVALDRHGLRAFERQLQFAAEAEELDWELDQDAGELRLGEGRVFSAQILGSESSISRTWLWSWANPSVEPAMTVAAQRLRSIGRDGGIQTFVDANIELPDDRAATLIALAASGLLDYGPYYRCPYPGGAAFVLVELSAGELAAHHLGVDEVILAAMTTAPEILGRRSIEAFLQDTGRILTPVPGGFAVNGGGEYRFDDAGRLVELRA